MGSNILITVLFGHLESASMIRLFHLADPITVVFQSAVRRHTVDKRLERVWVLRLMKLS
jgi:hypothetical protein